MSVDKLLIWLHVKVKSPPFSSAARVETGYLLRRLQRGESLGMPQSRPMPEIAARCHELRVRDRNQNWRIVYRIDEDAVLVIEVFSKTTRTTPQKVIDICRERLRNYDSL